MDCCRCVQLQKKLQILKSDYQFEIKKIQQDKSTEKVMYEIHLQKEVRRWQETYEKEKVLREDESKKWMEKYDGTVKQYKEQIKQLSTKHENQLKFELEKLSSRLNGQIKTLTSDYQEKIKTLTENYQTEITQLKQIHQFRTNQLVQENENLVANLKKSHNNLLLQRTRVWESKFLGLESQKVKQRKLHEQTKNESKEMQSRFYKQIFDLRKNIAELEGKLNDQIKDSKSKQETIDELHSTITQLKSDHQVQIENLNMQNSKTLEDCRESYKIKLSEMYKDTLTYCNKYQDAISKIQETRQTQRCMYLNNIEQINLCVENRASRPEDVEEIEYLRHTLAKKMKQCDSLSEEIRFFRLELENKEQTYNKIFVPIINPNNENIIYKRKEFKLRRQGRSVTTVREALQSLQSANMAAQKKSVTPYLTTKPKIL